MSFNYKRILLVGATAGIGATFADKLIEHGAKVIAVGRRQERLDEFVKKHGSDKASAVRFDVNDTAGMDAFIEKIVADYPDLDCVWLNSGTQHPIRLSQPEAVDLGVFHTEIATNFSRLVDLSIKFLPHLLRKPHPTALVVTGTLLALIPAVTVPAYSASKAALNAFMMCLRRQHQGASTRIIEVWPPATQTELHDYMGEKVGRNLGMPVQDFVDQAYDQLVAGADQVIVGTIGPEDQFLQLAKQRRQTFDGLSDMMLKHFQL